MIHQHMILVEPDADHAALARAAFTGTAFADRVHVVASVAEAVEQVRARGAPAVMVVGLDATLPDALASLARLRVDAGLPLLPLVVISNADGNAATITYAAGANSFVLKPADPDDLISVLQQVGLYWLRLNRPPSCD